MGLIQSLRHRFAGERATIPPLNPYQDNYLPYLNMGGNTYGIGPLLQQTLQGKSEPIGGDFVGLTEGAYKGNGVVFSVLNARLTLFKQARFMYRQLRSGTPGELFSTPDLDILRTPWPNGTCSDLLARMIQDADLGGNAFILRRGQRLVRLRPDWTVIVHGSFNDPNVTMWDPEADLLGYAYFPGGMGGNSIPTFYQVSEVAHFAPTPDPTAPARGMSWLTPLLRDVEADSAATAHKLAYFRNGATPNLVVTGVPGASPEQFQTWVDKFGRKHDGVKNAYRTAYLTVGMDAKIVGNDLAQIDFKVTQGAGETRIAAAGGVPPIVVGLSEGLQGSSLNAGNFQAAMRRFADLTGRSLWEDASGALATIVARKPGAELWYDDRYIPALKDDIKDFAEVQSLQAQAVRQYVDAGFEPESVVDAINAGDLKRLKHTGLYSVQLQPPGTTTPEPVDAPSDPEDDTPDDAAPDPAAGRDAVLWQLLAASERRADAAERSDRPAPVINVTTPENPVTVTIERGAVEISAPVTVEPAVVNVTTPEVRNEISVEPTPVEVTVEPAPVEIRNEISVEPTPLEITNEVSVDPTPITVEARADAPVVHVTAPAVTVTTPETI